MTCGPVWDVLFSKQDCLEKTVVIVPWMKSWKWFGSLCTVEDWKTSLDGHETFFHLELAACSQYWIVLVRVCVITISYRKGATPPGHRDASSLSPVFVRNFSCHTISFYDCFVISMPCFILFPPFLSSARFRVLSMELLWTHHVSIETMQNVKMYTSTTKKLMFLFTWLPLLFSRRKCWLLGSCVW